MTKQELREKLAAIEHERWADWQRYMHSRCPFVSLPGYEGEGLFITPQNVDHWERQIRTPYANLSEQEQASDMEQVDRYWPLIEEYIASQK
jgi:hypothetical protein